MKANKYDLSASRYRQIEQDEIYYEKPALTLQRLKMLNEHQDKLASELAAELK